MSELTGNVFHIQKFSLHDGPGIRTVVFFQGCPLRCKWCANPESQRTGTAAEQKTVSQVLEVCLQDRDFYEESGGGVTLSGGEPLVQPEFAAALVQALNTQGIHTALETTGCAGPSVFDEVAADAGLLLFDIKHWNAAKHQEGTGVDHHLMLHNLRRAMERGQEVLPRLPVIPGYNDSPADAAGFVSLLREVGAGKVQLLPFHQFGENKYISLGLEYAYQDIPALHEEDLKDFRQVFWDAGIHAFF